MAQLKVVKHHITNSIELQVDVSSQRKVTMTSLHNWFSGLTSRIRIVLSSTEYYDRLKEQGCGEAIQKDLTATEQAKFKWWRNSSNEASCEWALDKAHTISDMNKRFAKVTRIIEQYLNKK